MILGIDRDPGAPVVPHSAPALFFMGLNIILTYLFFHHKQQNGKRPVLCASALDSAIPRY